MTLEELIALYRADSLDDKEPPFCSDELLTIYANEGQDEACRRARLLVDSTSPMCSVAFNASDAVVDIDRRILSIDFAFAGGQEITVAKAEEMDAVIPQWQFGGASGMPSTLVVGVSVGKAVLWPTPDVSGVLRLRVQRLPMRPLVGDTDKPEIRQELHRGLVDWMLYRAYSRDDTDLYNDAKAGLALGRFEAEFGRKASGRNDEWIRSRGQLMPGPIA